MKNKVSNVFNGVKIKITNIALSINNFIVKHKKALLIATGIILVITLLVFVIPLPTTKYAKGSDMAIATGTFLDIDGYETFVQDVGEKDKPAIVLIHGFGGSTFSWRENIYKISEAGYRVIALDLKGFGLSQKGLEYDYSHEAQADFVKKVMEKLEVTKAMIVGHSMGGNVAVHFAQKYPESTEKLVLIDAAVLKDADKDFSFLINFPITRQAIRQVLARVTTKDTIKSSLESAYYNKELVTEDVINGYSKSIEIKDWDLSLIGITRDLHKNAIASSLDTLAMPVLIIWGENDTWISLEQGMQLNLDIPNAVFKVVRDAGHVPMEEKPEIVNNLLISFRE